MNVFAYQNSEDDVRLQSSSGGLFTTLAIKVLEGGGVVYGAAFDDNWSVKHIRVSEKSELWRLRGSKYVFSDFTESIKLALKDLYDDKFVLYSGTPCQVAAMRKRAGDNSNLLLVEVVCHGAPKPEYWNKYLNALCIKEKTNISEIKSVNFRDKSTGWRNYSFSIDFKNHGSFKELHDNNIYMRAFLGNYLIRNACFICPFKYPYGSSADITIGDFWGIQNLDRERFDDMGTSILILPTVKGETFVRSCNLMLLSYDYNAAVSYNKSIEECASKPAKYDSFLFALKRGNYIKTLERFAGMPLTLRLKLLISRILNKLNNGKD